MTDQVLVDNTLTRIRIAYPGLAKGARRIADFVLQNPQQVIRMSVTELSEATDSSEGSVVNFCKKMGLSGFQKLKLSLAQEAVQPVQFIHEDLVEGDDVATTCRKIFHSGIQTLRDTLSVLDTQAMQRAVHVLRAAKRIEIYGVGSSASVAEDVQYRMLRIGLEAKVVTDSHIQAISASRTSPDVAVLTISHTGATHETVVATKLAKAAGAQTIAITNYGRSPLQAHTDIVLFTMARETRFRTEAMTSRIAQLCVVDALIAALAMADYETSVAALQSTSDVLSIKRF